MTPIERFRAKVDITPGCWHWTAGTNDSGYGVFRVGDKPWKAHRFIYELLVGPIPEGLELDHTCHGEDCPGGVTCPHRRCVNPGHLEPVTTAENARRSPHTRQGKNVRRTHCPYGHPYDEANTYINRTTGSRQCIACRHSREAVSA